MKKQEAPSKDKVQNLFTSLFENLEKHGNNRSILGIIQSIFDRLIRFDKTIKKLETFRPFLESVKEKHSSADKTAQQGTMFSLVIFLFVFDLYVTLLDIVILLLVSVGHDLYDPEHQKYARTIEQVGEVSIETKFRFLKEHKYESLIRRKDQQLRNKIAHNNFEVVDDQKRIIEYRGNKYFVGEQLTNLLEFIIQIGEQLNSEKNTSN